MEKRDLIKDQIEQFGRVLGKILADFLGLKSSGLVEQGIEVASEQLKSNFDIDIDELITLPIKELKRYLAERKISTGHVEILGKYLLEIGESKISNDKKKANLYLTRSLELLDLEDELSNTISFERQGLKSNIENMLRQCL